MTNVIPIAKGKYRVDVPVRVIYRLDSDKTVVKEEAGTMSIPLEGNQLLHAQAEADRVGITLDDFFLEFVTHTYANRVAKDRKYLAEFKSFVKKYKCNILFVKKYKCNILFVKKYKCNILTEVTLNGQVEIHAVSADRS